MNKGKKTYEPAEINVVSFNSDMLVTSGGTLGENEWEQFDFNSL